MSIRFNCERHHAKIGTVKLKYFTTTDIFTDALTKPLGRVRYERQSDLIDDLLTSQNTPG